MPKSIRNCERILTLASNKIALLCVLSKALKEDHNILYEKLEYFIKKYYQNELIKGGILFISLSLITFFLISILEYFGHFESGVRSVMFSLFLLSTSAIFFWYVLRPAGGLFNIGRRLNYKRASSIIGSYFPEVKDKLLNTLELRQTTDKTASNALLIASIEQRTAELKPIPFQRAIRFRTNLKYVRIALVPASVLFIIMLITPGFKGSSERVVKFGQHFEIEAPFDFIVDESIFNTVQNRDLLVPVQLSGTEIPREVYIHIGDLKYKMSRESVGAFEYLIRNVQKGAEVWFEAAGFKSEVYTLDVALKPSLISYHAKLSYPKYLGLDPETISNMGEIHVPEGTSIQWSFETKNVDEIHISPQNEQLSIKGSRAVFSRIFHQSTLLKVKTRNSNVNDGDSLVYSIQVIPDAFPKIDVETKADSTSAKRLYFIGEIWDDHGFSKLSFTYKFKKSTILRDQTSGTLEVPFESSVQKQSFYHFWDLNMLNIQSEEEIEYYFTVWDNDGVNGAKSSRTPVLTYRAPSQLEIRKETEKKNEHIKTSISSAQAKASQLQKQLDEVKKLLTEKKSLDWNDQQKIQELLELYKEIQQEIEDIARQNEENNLKQEEFTKSDSALLEKKKKIEELFEQVLDEETKELLRKIEELMKQNQMQQLPQMMEQFQMSNQEMEKDLDRMLELFKELELEQKLQQTISDLQELSQKQQELSDKTEKSTGSNEELIKEQDSLNKAFDRIQKDFEDIEQKNQELEKPKDINVPTENSNETRESMEQSKENMEKGKNSKASQQQKSAAEKMKEMAEDLQEQVDEAYSRQQVEDYNTLRQILENLVQLSKDQEQLINGFKSNQQYNARYVELRQLQRRITDESKIVEDSLLALSKRNPVIAHFINDEIGAINHHLDEALMDLGERKTGDALVNQQMVMKGYNVLALMLSESLEQMQNQIKQQQQQQKNQQQSSGQCKNPGNSQGKANKPNAQAIKQLQDELSRQMKEMMEGKKNGKEPSSREFAEMAAKQAALRKKLQDLERELKEQGQGGALGDLQKTQDLMDEIEENLYNKVLDEQLMQKLEQLDIRLSEHERAEQNQDMDEERKGEEAKEQENQLPPHIQKYLDEKRKELEMLKTVSPELQPYYKQKVKNYFTS